MGGVGLQELFILCFTCLALRFHSDMKKIEAEGVNNRRVSSWRPLMLVEYVGLAFISARNIYRLIEFSQGWGSPVAKAEAAFYVLDAAPMLLATFLFNVFHPGRTLVGPDSEFPKKKKGKKEKKECGSEENRMWHRADSEDEAQEMVDQA